MTELKCSNCGQPLEIRTGEAKTVCGHCGAVYAIQIAPVMQDGEQDMLARRRAESQRRKEERRGRKAHLDMEHIPVFLKNEEWYKADKYCDRVLLSQPDNPQLYIWKLMAELELCHQEELRDHPRSVEKNEYYRKALSLADDKLRDTLQSYITRNNATDEDSIQGCDYESAVVSVTVKNKLTRYADIYKAIEAVKGAAAEDNAVVQLLASVDLSMEATEILSGQFALDLNGFELRGKGDFRCVVSVQGGKVNIIDSGHGGKITGSKYGIIVSEGAVTLSGGTISGTQCALWVSETGKADITGGTVSAGSEGIWADDNSSVTVSGGDISGGMYGIEVRGSSTLEITGGTISGSDAVRGSDEGIIIISGGTVKGKEQHCHG